MLVLLHFLLHRPRIYTYALLHLIRYAKCTTREREARGVGAGPQDGVLQGLDNIDTNLVLPSGKPRRMSYYFKL